MSSTLLKNILKETVSCKNERQMSAKTISVPTTSSVVIPGFMPKPNIHRMCVQEHFYSKHMDKSVHSNVKYHE
jgi:hypothetical protein